MLRFPNCRSSLRSALCAVACLLAAGGTARAQDKVTYQDHVLPLFRNACLNCHNPDKKKAGLDLSSFQAMMAGSNSGKVLEPGDADGSLLYRLVTHAEEPAMPPKGDKLPDDQVAVIKNWIAGGLLETSGSAAIVSTRPKVDLAVAATGADKPEGPPPMPGADVLLEPVVRTARPGALTALASSPWAPLVAVAGQKQVLLYNPQSQDLLGVLPFPEGLPYTLKFSRGGGLLLAGGGEGAKAGKVVLFDVTTGSRVTEVGEEFDSVLAADISPDQTHVALGGPDKVVKIFATANGSMRAKIKKHTDWVTAVAYSPDGVLLASGDRSGGLHVWESGSANLFYTLSGHQSAITDLCYRADSNVLVSSSEDGTVRMWEMNGGTEIKNWQAHGGTGVLSVEFTHDGRMVTAGRDKVVRVWGPDGSAIKETEPFNDIALHATFNFDGTLAIAGDWTGEIRVTQAADGARVGTLDANPLPIADRLAAAEKKLAEAQAANDAAAAALAAAQQAAQQATTDAQAAQADATAKQQAADQAAAAGNANLAQIQTDAQTAAQNMAAKTEAARVAGEAVAPAQQAADAAAANLAKAKDAVARLKVAQFNATTVFPARQELAARQAEAATAAAGTDPAAAEAAKLKVAEAQAKVDAAAAQFEQMKKELTPAAPQPAPPTPANG